MARSARTTEIIRREIHAAEIRIEQQLGRRIRLKESTMREEMTADEGDMFELFGLVAQALGMTMDDYFEGKQVIYVDLRTLAAMFIRRLYPRTTLVTIGKAMGIDNHASVINLLERGGRFLELEDEEFMPKYQAAYAALEKWKTKNDATGKDSDLRGRAVGSAGER